MKLPASEIPKLLAVKEVKAVYPNAAYKPDSIKGKDVTLAADAIYPQMDKSAPYIGADQAWKSGYTGKGIKVAVIDTGVDYTHPDLKNNFGPYKGYDFVDNDYDPQETPAGDRAGKQLITALMLRGPSPRTDRLKVWRQKQRCLLTVCSAPAAQEQPRT